MSLSARRFEVNRLELTLSIASFAAAIGAVRVWGVMACVCVYMFVCLHHCLLRSRHWRGVCLGHDDVFFM